MTSLLRSGMWALHSLDFGIPAGTYLSTGIGIDYERVLLAPMIGGLLLGLVARALRRWRSTEIVDPIEANALYGGRMSFVTPFALR